MSNDLIELTNTDLDAVSGGKGLNLNFGNIVTQVNDATLSAAIVNMGTNSGAATITQSFTGSNTSSITGGSPTFGNFGNFSF